MVNGLQRVRPGAAIQPERVAMGERRKPGNEQMVARNARVAMNTSAERQATQTRSPTRRLR